MSPDEFRRHAHAVVDWMADYIEGVEDHPVMSPVAPGDVAERLPEGPPETGEPMETIFRDFERVVLPYGRCVRRRGRCGLLGTKVPDDALKAGAPARC